LARGRLASHRAMARALKLEGSPLMGLTQSDGDKFLDAAAADGAHASPAGALLARRTSSKTAVGSGAWAALVGLKDGPWRNPLQAPYSMTVPVPIVPPDSVRCGVYVRVIVIKYPNGPERRPTGRRGSNTRCCADEPGSKGIASSGDLRYRQLGRIMRSGGNDERRRDRTLDRRRD